MKQLFYFSCLLVLFFSTNSCTNSENNNSKSDGDTTATEQMKLMDENEETIIFATVTGGVPTFVVNTSTLLTDWQTYLSSLPEIGPCTLNNAEILLHEEKYYMIASGMKNGEPLKSTIPLQSDETNNLFVTGLTISCTTEECASESFGCIPNITSCTPCANGGKCTKSTTASPKVIFPNL